MYLSGRLCLLRVKSHRKHRLDRPLEVGGCPALVHKKRAGDIYMDLVRLYIETAEQLKHKRNTVTAELLADSDDKADISPD